MLLSPVKEEGAESPDEIKKTLRTAFKKKRESLSEKEKTEYAKALFERICTLDAFKEAEAVLSFVPIGSETDVSEINAEVLRLGKRLLLPKCIRGTREMNFYAVSSPGDLEKGSFSIMEPKDGCPLFIPSESVKTLCIVPALAYDRQGYRLGYGGGYYDRYLSRCRIKTVGAVYHPFIYDAPLPRDAYDVAADTVVTDKEIINIKK